MKFVNESIYWHWIRIISDCVNRLVHEVLGCAPAIILTIFVCEVKIFPLLEGLPPQNCSILYKRMKMYIVNSFESVNVTDMDHQPNSNAPIDFRIIRSKWVFQFRWLSICKRRNFVFVINFLVCITICNAECDEFFVMNFIIVVLSKFMTKLLAANHLIIWERTKFVTEQKSSKFLLKIMTLVLSANNTCSDIDFILRGRLYIYIYIYIL